MAAIEKRLLVPSRRRVLPSSGFSWIDRRLVRDGFLSGLTSPESLLYFFLIAVADQDGLSFYGDRRTAALLKLSEAALEQARRGLERKDLVRYRPPLYQVLSLPDAPSVQSLAESTLPPNHGATQALSSQPAALGNVLRRMLDPPAAPPGGHPR